MKVRQKLLNQMMLSRQSINVQAGRDIIKDNKANLQWFNDLREYEAARQAHQREKHLEEARRRKQDLDEEHRY